MSTQLLEDMTNYDKDKRFMAAIDLTAEISNNPQGLEINVQRRVCSAFLKQLDDQSVEVQGNAVKCLAKIVCRLDMQIPEVVSKVSFLVLDGKAEVRDIYATCMKGLLSELPESSSTMVCQNVFPKMLQGISSPCNDVKEECTDVLCDLLKRFGENKVWWNEQEKITQSLLGLLSQQYKSSLRKKASACIGVLSSVSSDRQLDHICKVLFQEVRTARTKQEKHTYIQCIGVVSKNVGGRIGPHLENIPALLIEICRSATADVNMSESTEDYEVVELCLNALESFVVRCPKEISKHLDQLSELMIVLLSFDPNLYQTDDMSDDVMDSDDDNIDSEDDDSAWKVRRAALKCLASIVKTADDERLSRAYSQFVDPLIERFKVEREENVKLDSFTTFQAMIYAAVTKDGLKSAAEFLISRLPQTIAAFQKQLRSKSIKIRQGIISTIKIMSESMPHQLEPYLVGLENELLVCMKDKNNSIRLDAINILFNTSRNYHNAEVYQRLAPTIFPLLLEAVEGGSYYTIIAGALRAAGVFLNPLRPLAKSGAQETNVNGSVNVVLPLFQIIRRRLESTDIDQEVKERGLECLGQLLAGIGDLPQCQERIQSCLPPFVDRMRNEVTRGTAIRALKTMCDSPIHVPIESILTVVVQYLCEYLPKNSRSFRQLCLDSLVSVTRKYGSVMNHESHALIIKSVANYIVDDDLYLTDLSVQIFINSFSIVLPSDDVLEGIVLVRVLEILRSPLLQGGALGSILELLALIARKSPSVSAKFSAQLGDISVVPTNPQGARMIKIVRADSPQAKKQIIATLARCLATIAVETGGKCVEKQTEHFLSILKGPVDSNRISQIELSTLALGEMGKKVDLGSTNVCEALLSQLNSTYDDLSVAAALALGMCSVGAMGSVLNTVVEQIQVANSKTQYLLLSSLREVISFDADSQVAGGTLGQQPEKTQSGLATKLEPHVPNVLPILKQFSFSSEEGVRHIVAECFGSLLVIHQQAVLQTLAPMMASGQWEERMVAVSSVRFAAKIPRCEVTTLEPLLESFLQCLGDAEISVRKSALQAVNVIILSPCLRPLLKNHAEMLLERCWIDGKPRPNLVREVDLGPFKHKVDDGLPLRKSAYNVVTSLLAAYPDKIQIKSRFMDFVLQGFTDGEDIQALSCQLLSDLCSRKDRPEETVVAKLGELLDPFDRCITRSIKQIQAKQQVGRANDTLRLYIRTLKSVEVVAESVNHKNFTDFITRLQKEPIFSQAYQGSLMDLN